MVTGPLEHAEVPTVVVSVDDYVPLMKMQKKDRPR